MQIYENRRVLYLTSKYGGIFLSVLTLLLYNRYVIDVLSSVKAFDAHLLRSARSALQRDRSGDGDRCQTFAETGIYVRIAGRLQAAQPQRGKKITAGDGSKAIVALFRYRVG